MNNGIGLGGRTRREFLKMAAAGAVLAAPAINRNAYALFAGSEAKYSARAIDLVAQSPVIDMLGVLTINQDTAGRWLHSKEGMSADEIGEFLNSGIRVFHNAFGMGGREAYTHALAHFAEMNGFLARYSMHFKRIATVADLQELLPGGRVGIMLGVQNADHFRTPDDVKQFHGMGQRVAQLTYNRQNLIGCGATERQDCGISDFGAAVIEQMNEVGMLVDVSHCGDRTTLEAFDISKKPVAITHSNCRALNPHPRLKTDEAIRKMAKNGGVMGITGVRMFVRDQEPTTIDHLVDHIDHVARLVGIEHVGIGSDADLKGYDALPPEQQKRLRAAYKDSYAFRDRIDIEGFDHPKKVYDLTEALIRRGYRDADIQAVLGGNFKRLLEQVWIW